MLSNNSPLVVLQARVSSSRLPGKALLDFHGLPLVILAARRAGNRGARVIVATSSDRSDDALAHTAALHGIDVCRGPLDDVLARFVAAIHGVCDDSPIIRLTGDNVMPDGELIADVLKDFEARKLDYITTTDFKSGLPYGCAVEVTRACHLRKIANIAACPGDREHVTPMIQRLYGSEFYAGYQSLNASHLRATIDCLDDYCTMHRSVIVGTNLTHLSVPDWVRQLKDSPDAPSGICSVNKLVLGTAQLGMAYGIARQTSPEATESLEMIRRAVCEGITCVDTARAYGNSEALIGQLLRSGWGGRFRVITKLSPFGDVPDGLSPFEVSALVENSLLRSSLALFSERLDCVLLHRTKHLWCWEGAAFETLVRWKAEARIGALGVSVQTPEELKLALSYEEIEHIQLPYNILDYRWDASVDTIRATRLKRNLVVHIRSVLLQGLLCSTDHSLWQVAQVDKPEQIIDWLSQQASALGFESVTQFCISYARSLDWADGVVIGCDNLAQLNHNLKIFNQSLLSQEIIDMLHKARPHIKVNSLDPSQWVSCLESDTT